MKFLNFKMLRWALFIACCAAFCLVFLSIWPELRARTWKINRPLLTFALLACVLIYFLDAKGWLKLLKLLGQNISSQQAISIWILSSYSRYIPGVIWPYASRIYLSKKENIPINICVSSMILENIFLLSSAALVSLPLLITYFPQNLVTFAVIFIVGAVPAVWYFVLRANRLSRIISTIIRLQERDIPSFRQVARAFGYYFIFWILFALAFTVFSYSVASLSDLSAKYMLTLFCAFPASFCIGLIASIAPGGLGVREITLYALLITIMPKGEAMAISLSSRLWLMLAEALTFAIVAGLMPKKAVAKPL
jgi:uncharacterized membrane protein YbhN (UPF0104 family)